MIIKLKQALASQEDVKVPDDFNKKVWDKISMRAPARPAGLIFRPVFVFSGAAAVVAALLIVLAVRTGPGSKAASFIAKAPAAVKTQLAAKKEYFKKILAAAKIKPAQEKNNGPAAGAPQETGREQPGGRVAVKNAGSPAQKTYYINEPPAEKNVSAAAVNKHPPELAAPLVIKNNVIKPLSGGRMSIAYKVEDTCDVSIVVYNRKGEPVKTVYRGSRPRGVYEDYWMGDDDRNMAVTDGIYVVYIKTGLTEQKIKAMVVK